MNTIKHTKDDCNANNLFISSNGLQCGNCLACEMNRQNYLKGDISHKDYYSEIAKQAGIAFIKDNNIVKEAIQSIDKNLNDIELYRWDSMANNAKEAIKKVLPNFNETWSLAVGVCVIKQAVKNAMN